MPRLPHPHPTPPTGRVLAGCAGGGAAWAGTFLSGGVVRVETPGHRDHLEDEVIPSLADHVHHLPVADLHDILTVHLQGDTPRLGGRVLGGAAGRGRGSSSGAAHCPTGLEHSLAAQWAPA